MPAAPTSFSGRAYGADYGGLMTDILEIVPDLWFPQSVWVYSKMQHDPQIRGVLAAYTLPIRRADWRVDPAGCRPEVAALVADDLGLPLLGEDPKPAGARRRGVVWADHLRLAVQGHLVYGFYPFEKRYDTESDPGRAHLVELAERVPASVTKIHTDDSGQLLSCQQDVAKSKPIPRSSLVWYANEREGAQWSGKSMLRSAYGPWLLKHETWRVHATSIRRFGMGVPSVEAPVGGTVQQVTQAQLLASSMRAGETSGMGLPAGFKAQLVGLTGSVPDALAFIRYLDQQMATMAIAGVLDLGSTPNGSRALGDVFMDLLQYAVQSVGDSVAATATADIAVQLVDFNFSEDEPAPRVVCGDVGAEREVTIEALQILLDSGALSPDPELEAYLRSKYNLPERTSPAPSLVPVPPASDIPVAASAERRGGQAPVRAAAGSLRRDPTAVEAAAKTDFEQVQAQWQTALDKLVADWGPVKAGQIDDVVSQVEAAVKADDREALAAMTVDTADAAAELESAMLDVADEAAKAQAAEAKAQGVTVAPGSPDTVRISADAGTFAALMGAGLVASAARKALQTWGPGATPVDVGASVRSHLTSLTDASLRDSLGAGLSSGQNAGRIATLRAAPAAARYAASEILDDNTCEACADVDGTEFASLGDAEENYATGGYVDCLGGLRCRGIIVTIWDESSLSQAA